jgi:hypothetical protein
MDAVAMGVQPAVHGAQGLIGHPFPAWLPQKYSTLTSTALEALQQNPPPNPAAPTDGMFILDA